MKMKVYLMAMSLAIVASCSRKGADNTIFSVDENKSAIEWKGIASTHFHEGGFKASGTLEINDKNRIVAGNFKIPISSITNFDLPENRKHELLDHLKSSDFFNVVLHPNATFKITKVEDYKEEGTNLNAKVTGNFTMIGRTNNISFPAEINITPEGISVNGKFELNRLQYGMDKYNNPEETLYILPGVKITLRIFCNRS
ncbi:YceI family protein [Pseudobacter ginsenosidimutans]|uniref:Polyisoprenoid-binding protein YceI n=1 Tax=Pseudobacter ginsenosidimutans TaxID=661488 RepID=A0A4Q7MRX1_9BACT|nr:YceI family protein [Pseudobacter ginsenosidimutans]QEC41975.1 YceI family protein [Pseudobacter ginsenosidimutans]RZS71198.1 polyisoprenoid-binding protein YceI [Pseudobacter ginsenosidimutans]